MAFSLSPGVRWKEIDLSYYVPALGTTAFGVVGTATKGPINERTLISSVDQLVRRFGYKSKDHPGLVAAEEYLREGNQLWFVRVDSAATPATVATASLPMIDGSSLTLNSKDKGTFYNNVEIVVDHSQPKNAQEQKLGSTATGTGPYVMTFTLGGPIVAKSLLVKLDPTGTPSTVVQDTAGTGTLSGTGVSGTINYLTGVVTLSFVADPGVSNVYLATALKYSTFNVIVNKTVGGKKYKFEEWRNLSLNSQLENYYASSLNSSSFITTPTLTVMPSSGTVTLTGGTDGLTGITDSDYIGQVLSASIRTGLQLFANSEQIDINTVAIPGITTDVVTQALLTLAETRRDCIALIDPPKSLSPELVVDWADGANSFDSHNAVNSTYAAIYYPWVSQYDQYNSETIYAPPSGYAAAAFARTDKLASIADAPAGATRGKVLGALGVEYSLEEGQRSFLYQNRINPVSDFIAIGIVLWGQKTSQVFSSSTDRVAARRLLNYIEKQIVTALQPVVFERINTRTYNKVISIVQPTLDGYVAREELRQGLVVCDDVINQPDTIAQNNLIVNVLLELPKYAEIITVNFVLLPTGARIEEYVGRQF